MTLLECPCECHRVSGRQYCMPCCNTQIECAPVVDGDKLTPAEQTVIDDAKELMGKVIARIEQSTKQYGKNYILANVMKETEDEVLDIIGWPLLEAIRIRQLFLHKLGQLDGKYLVKFVEAQTSEYLTHLKEKIDVELGKRQ